MDQTPLMERRSILKGAIGLAVAGLATVVAACQGGSTPAAATATPAPNAKPYEKAIENSGPAKAFFASPHLSNVTVYFVQARNWIEAMVKAYGYPADQVRLVFVNYGPMNFITYNDSIWANYKAGEWQGVSDPKTKAPAVRNPFADDVKQLQDQRCVFYT